MIDLCVAKIFGWITRENVELPENLEVYKYVLHSSLLDLVPIIITLILGMFFKNCLEGIAMIVPYMIIRKFSGGYHLKKFTHCFTVSCCLITLGYVIILIVDTHPGNNYFDKLVMCAAVLIVICSPIENQNRAITEAERKFFKLLTGTLMVFFTMVYSLLRTMECRYTIGIGIGILLVFGLQVPCIIPILLNKCAKQLFSRSK